MNLERDLPPQLRRTLNRIGTPIGVTIDNWTRLETMSRPWWLYRSHGRLPAGKIERRPPAPVTAEDVALCERLLSAFALATQTRGAGEAQPGIWNWILNTYQRELAETLTRGDAHALAVLMASMFQQEFVWGVAHGGHVRESKSWLGAHILRLKTLDALVSLAEALGAVPVENPEQGAAGIAFADGVPALMARLDSVLGFRFDAPEVGAPFGLELDGRVIPLEGPDQIYGAARLDRALRAHLPERHAESVSIVEIGAGYGGLCHWLLKIRPATERYTIIDLPISNVLQGYFLGKALGAEAVALLGEERPARVAVLPDSALDTVRTPFDILVNKDSMPEMPQATMRDYLEWGREHCGGFFYSYNQEATAEFLGKAQERVSATVDVLGGFERLRRDPSWMRRGYVEEIYLCSARPAAPELATSAPFAQEQPPRVGGEEQRRDEMRAPAGAP